MARSSSLASRGVLALAAAALLSMTAACGPVAPGADGADPAGLDLTGRSTPAGDRHTGGVGTIAPGRAAPTTAAASPPPAVPVAPGTETTRKPGASTTPRQAPTGADTGQGSTAASGGSGGSSTATPPPAPAAPAVPGAPLTNRTASFSAAGYTADYRVFAESIDTSKPVGLLVYADGTGEYGLENPSSSYAIGGSGGLAAVARAHNMVLVTPFSPNRSCTCWEQGDATGYADYVAALISQVRAQYGAGPLWFSGYSSGAQAATRFVFPAHPELWSGGGGVIAIGGGGAPAGPAASIPASVTSNVVMRWDTGAQDTGSGGGFNALSGPYGAQAGERWYASQGFNTQLVSPAEVTHDRSGQFGRIVNGFLG
ncbi:MAG: hypothetical protein JWR41_3110 [Modestobacter sp.]|nr:hypothetical protein [Modestobacter sp.]